MISNDEIKLMSEKYAASNYFKIWAGKNTELQAEEVNGEHETGIDKFENAIIEANELSPDFIYVEFYKPTKTGFSRKPFFSRKVKLQKQTTPQQLNGIFPEFLGGVEGYLASTVKAASFDDIKTKLHKSEQAFEALKEKFEKQREELSEKKAEYSELKRLYDWDVKMLNEDKRIAIERADLDRKSSDRILTIGGQIAANIMGINKETLSGLLGGDIAAISTNDNEDNYEKETHSPTFKPDLVGKKAEASELVSELSDFFIKTIELNTDTDALMLMQKIYEVNKFMFNVTNIEYLIEKIREKNDRDD